MTMQQDLKALEERWGLALQSAAFGVWDLDPRAHQVQYSPEWKAMLGYGDLPAEVTADTDFWRSRVHPDDLQPMLAALHAHLTGSAAGYAVEFRLRAADGSWRWVLSRGRVVERDVDGEPLRVVGTLTDLTEHRELQAARLARDHAEAASRAKTEFLSRMSHELRTPLNAVLGFAQLLSRRLGDGDIEGQRTYVAHIEQAGWHLLAMVNDVLDLQRVESGQLALQMQAVALAPLWDAVATSMTPLAAARGVHLAATALPPRARVQADPARLKQVLGHLLGNAIKFSQPGGSVTFGVSAEGPQWRLRLGDTGQGIPTAQLPHLFEAFNRLGRVGPGADGVGIGLVLSRTLVQQMGGELVVHSTPGVGTTVEVDLPRADGAALR
ncbi:MAG: PAS domain-containing sensor histidine kinase [Rubrivivax sp.]|nr:PAS domain-containing sensor histidine kinase [Rubrivivax sp.]